MRPSPLLASLVALLILPAGCGTDERYEGVPASSAAFPVRVEHKFGTTVVPAKPRRVVVAGRTEQDTVLALGSKPRATTEWYGDQPHAVWPWARAALGDSEPEVLDATGGFQFEKIADLRPGLILAINSGMTRADYRRLSRLAPTIAAGTGSTGSSSPWDEQVGLIAAALGKPDEGRAIVQAIKDDYAKAARAHPEFRGKSVTFIRKASSEGRIHVVPAGPSTEFLTMLGFKINPGVRDADVMVVATQQPSDVLALERVPAFGRLPAVSEHRVVYTDSILAGAMDFMSPLSLPYVLERLTPLLEAAVARKAPQRVSG